MRLKYKVMLAVFLLVFVFSERVSAAEGYVIHYLEADGEVSVTWREKEIFPAPNLSPEEKAAELFREFFSWEGNDFAPEGTEVISVHIKDSELIINVSRHIRGYGGGTYFERSMRDQIVKTALDIPGIKYVTLLIENEPALLPEGIIIYKYFGEEPKKCQDVTEGKKEPYGK